MRAPAIDLYVAAFRARCDAMRGPGQPTVVEPGVCGLLAGTDDPHIRLLVTDDRAHDTLAALLPDLEAGMITICSAAAGCTELVAGRPEWTSDVVTAMVCRRLRTVPDGPIPGGLTVRSVRRLADDPLGGVALQDAVAAAMAADPAIEGSPGRFAGLLRSLPPAYRLFAAVDRQGTVRATSGSGVFGRDASVIFVNTDLGWRGRGIGQAMTARALGAAQRSGATQASLTASAAGRSVYRRLGFESAGTLTRFRTNQLSARRSGRV